ncbi:MAG: efflux transporter outer membrane subunit [Pelovirga sp.]
MKTLILSVTLCALLLGGCSSGPEYQRPNLDLPEQWHQTEKSSDHHIMAMENDWWSYYQDPLLNRLIERALSDNLTLRLQLERIRESRARLGFASAQRLPSLDGQAEAARTQQSAAVSAGDINNSFSLTGMLSYEVDIWGRLARSRESALAQFEASHYSHDAVRLQLIGDVISTYTNLRAAQEQLRITERTLGLRHDSLELQQIRYDGGVIDQLGLQQARSEWEAVRALIPLRQEQVTRLESALAVLTGMSPAELMGTLDFGDGRLDQLTPQPAFPDFLPSELLERRPDIRATEATLMAANAQLGVTMAERLPRFNLALFLGSVAGDIDDLLKSSTETWGISGAILGPLVDFGRNRARVETVTALRDQAKTNYRITVQTAFREVRDALLLTSTIAEREIALRRQQEAAEKTLELVELRYQEGYSSFIEVLDAQRQLLGAELALTEATRDRLNATTALFKTLGGGWQAVEK